MTAQIGNNFITMATYGYDNVGNLATVTYGNGVVHTYSYDNRNRLANLGVANGSANLFSYNYTVDAAGHRTSVTEQSGRTVNYGYDNLYRLTSETIASDSSGMNGNVSYTYDPVGNRTQKTSTLPGYPGGLTNYNANDQLSTDTYDANGNTTASGATGYVYDFENHLISANGITYVYDGDGHRISKTVNGTTTSYATTDINPTGYSQVVGESYSGNINVFGSEHQHTYFYGLDAVLELRDHYVNQNILEQQMYFVHDGHGSVRAVTGQNGAVTDTYDYDAFGVLIHQTGSTPNTTLYSGEQFDPDLGLYFNRARYLNVSTGRFWNMDSYEGVSQDPRSLHKYLYSSGEPVDMSDPTGNFGTEDVTAAAGIIGVIASQSLPLLQNIAYAIYFNLYRVPQLIDTVASALVIAQAGTHVVFTAANVVERLARNLQTANARFSVAPSQMGSDVENAAGANLARNTQSYDYYDLDSQTVVQLKGTRQTSSPQALLGVFKQGIANLNNAPEKVSTTYRDGTPVTIVRSALRSRVVMVAIPEEPVSWDFRAFMIQLETLEQQEQMILKAVPTPNLE